MGRLPGAAQRRIGFPWSAQMVERARRYRPARPLRPCALPSRKVAPPTSPEEHTTHSPIAGQGYCVFNDVAVAARAARRDGLARGSRSRCPSCTIAGNVHPAIFTAPASSATCVFTFSMHGAKNFPFRKEISHLDVELEDDR